MDITKNNDTSFKINQDDLDIWFENFIDYLRTDHFLLSEKLATNEKTSLYKAIMGNDAVELAKATRKQSSMIFIKSILSDYLDAIHSQKLRPKKLALGLSDSKILVWSEIEDNNEDMENVLLLAEAKVNGKYQSEGFYINSTIIEESDNLEIPPHYQKIIG